MDSEYHRYTTWELRDMPDTCVLQAVGLWEYTPLYRDKLGVRTWTETVPFRSYRSRPSCYVARLLLRRIA